jgi:hypothetical protein
VTTRRPIHINVALPEITPAQADLLWNFLEDLAAQLWDAYEKDLLQIEDERSRPPDPESNWTAAECDDLLENGPLPPDVSDEESDPDF